MTTRSILLILSALLLSSCSVEDADNFMAKREAKSEIASALRDPDSAEFRNIVLFQMNGSPMVCGEVNGKNAFGAKGGFQYFLFRNPLMRIGEDAASSSAIARCCSHLAKTGTTGSAKTSPEIEACAELDPPMVLL